MKTDLAVTGVTLTDPRLFRQACYVDGVWLAATAGATIAVGSPLPSRSIAVSSMRCESSGSTPLRLALCQPGERPLRKSARESCDAGSTS